MNFVRGSFCNAQVLSNKFGKRPTSPDTDPTGVSPGRRGRRSRQHSARSDKYQTMSSDDEDRERPVVGGGGVGGGQATDREHQYEGDEDDTYSVSEKEFQNLSVVCVYLNI